MLSTHARHHAPRSVFFLLTIGLFILPGLSTLCHAQQPTATLTQFNGNVVVTIAGKESPAAVGMALSEGDTIETKAKAAALLTLSEGSVVEMTEKTKLNLAVLLQTETQARKSRLKILYGKIRAVLSSGHQKEGSKCDLETPNAQVGVQFSQPEVEVLYEPKAKTTIVRAYTVGVSVLNLLTKAEVREMPKEHQAIIKDSFILVTKVMEMNRLFNEIDGLTRDRGALTPLDDMGVLQDTSTEILLNTWYTTRAADPLTSQIPGPETRPEEPGQGAEPVDAEIIINIP